jgi:hypothetical protein
MSDDVDNNLEQEEEILDEDVSDELLNLSDDELMSMDFDALVAKNKGEAPAAKPADAPATAAAPAAKLDDDADEDDDAAKAAALAAAGNAEGGAPAEAPADGKGADAEAAAKAAVADKDKVEPVVPADEAGKAKPEDQLARLFAPFKANGKDMQVKDVDEAIALMQMGANYTKKMAGLKPNLKLMKLLENNGLLSEEKLSFLIDLDKKNPQAIGKLLKDSGIDPLDVDVDKQGEYKPNTYTVDDRELALDAVLDEVQGTPSYGRLIEVVSNKWDAPSKQVIAGNPQLLKVINNHMASGHYDIISNEIERERTFGRLAGLSDLEAYRQVGDALDARGAFNHLAPKPVATATPPQQVVVEPKAKPDDSALKDKKRAASPTKATAAAPGVDPEFNPLSLSDADFAKFDFSKIK